MLKVVQSVFKHGTGGGGNTSITTSAISTTSGNALIVFGACFANHIGSAPFSDSGSHTWSIAVANTGATKGWAACGYVTNITGSGSHTFTFTVSVADFIAMAVFEVQGLDASPFNHSATSTASTSTHSSGSITADAGVDELHFGFMPLSATTEAVTISSVTSTDHAWSSRFENATATTEGWIAAVASVPSGGSTTYAVSTGSAQNETIMNVGFKGAAPSAGGAYTAAYA
jgi:hypothetical protein